MHTQILTKTSFPYHEDNPILYNTRLKNYHSFKINPLPTTLGYIPNAAITTFQWPTPTWTIDPLSQTITLMTPPTATAAERSEVLADTVRRMAECGKFEVLRRWRDERFPVYGPEPGGEVVVEIERAASALYGIVTCGVQMLCYTETETKGEQGRDLKLWIGRRSRSKQTYPGMLDSTAAGGLEAGITPRHAMIREATEEATLPPSLLHTKLYSTGCISYFHVRGHLAGGETNLLQPELEYLYECKLDVNDPIPRPEPGDSEVEEFGLWSVEEVMGALRRGEFKPNSAVVVVDFLVRHGVVGPEKEPRYLEIMTRLHRRLPFPTPRYC